MFEIAAGVKRSEYICHRNINESNSKLVLLT